MWVIETTDTFDEWFDALDDTDRANVLASMMVLRDRGPMLSRPYADTVNGSSYSNMKELQSKAKEILSERSLRSIQSVRGFFSAPVTRPGTRKGFMK